MRIEQFLTMSADSNGNKPAVVAGGRAHSYAGLARAAERVAAALADRGVRPGDRVAVFMNTTPAAVAVTFGVLMAGAIVCVVDKKSEAEDLERFVAEHRPVAVAVDTKFAAPAAKTLASSADVRVVLLSGGGANATNSHCLSVDDMFMRISAARRLPANGAANDAAIVLIGLDAAEEATRPITLSHAEVVAGAESTEPRTGFVLRSMFTFAGFCHLAEAIRTGVTVVLDGPFEMRNANAPLSRATAFDALVEAG